MEKKENSILRIRLKSIFVLISFFFSFLTHLEIKIFWFSANNYSLRKFFFFRTLLSRRIFILTAVQLVSSIISGISRVIQLFALGSRTHVKFRYFESMYILTFFHILFFIFMILPYFFWSLNASLRRDIFELCGYVSTLLIFFVSSYYTYKTFIIDILHDIFQSILSCKFALFDYSLFWWYCYRNGNDIMTFVSFTEIISWNCNNKMHSVCIENNMYMFLYVHTRVSYRCDF